MRSYVCGQCHSEYYFEPGTTHVILSLGQGAEAGPDIRVL